MPEPHRWIEEVANPVQFNHIPFNKHQWDLWITPTESTVVRKKTTEERETIVAVKLGHWVHKALHRWFNKWWYSYFLNVPVEMYLGSAACLTDSQTLSMWLWIYITYTFLSSLQVITISSSQSASPVTSTVPSATSTLQPLVKLDSGSGPGLTGSRPMQKYIVVSLPSSASSSLESKSSVLPTSISSTPLEAGMKLDRSESPGASTQSPHWDFR